MFAAEKELALRQLKDILLSEDEKRLAELENELEQLQVQIADKESLIRTLDPVIADLLDRKIVDSKDEFIDIIAPIIGGSIKKQVTEAKDDIVDALYPVIGKTIRKSVAEAMKNLVNSVNERIEKSFQYINIFNVFKSKITGVSQGELVLRQSMPFRIEEIFIIRKENGLLAARASRLGDESTIDQELVSGMFTAIKDFVATAFVKSPDQDLNEIEYGDYNIRLDVQNNFYTAAVIRGVMPNDFPDKLNKLGNRIHNRFYKTIREFDGDPRPLEGCVAMLKSFISSFDTGDKVETTKKSKPFMIYALIALFVIAATFFGIKVGLPYLANDQLEKQANQILAADATFRNDPIKITAKKSHLTLTGSVTSIKNRLQVDSLMHTIPDVTEITNKLRIYKSNDELAKRIELALTPYRTLIENDIRFVIENDRVILEGYVPNPQTRHDISQIIGELEGVSSVINNLSATKQNEKEKLGAYLQSNPIYFTPNQKELDQQHFRTLDYIVAKTMLLEKDKLVVAGYSDDLSSPAYNLKLSQERAQVVAAYLQEKKLTSDRIIIKYYGEDNPVASNLTEAGRSLNRRVELTLSGS